jgi:heme/copper-type cytochrome/quinol oxidase subunit 3
MDNKLLIKLLVGTEAMFFLALIMAYAYFSLLPGFPSQQVAHLEVNTTGIFSLFLFTSSFTFWRAETNYNKGKMTRLKSWLLLTLLLGFIFLIGQGSEYHRLLTHNVSISSSLFGTSFYTLTGFHGLHVFAGLVVMSIVTTLTFMGDYNRSPSSVFTTLGIYWHFVDIVWLFVFGIVYVLPHLHKITSL